MLRRHLNVVHSLDPAAYHARWKLPIDCPITAPAYSARRSGMAKERGLGRKRGRREPKSAPVRRSRLRNTSASKAAAVTG
jgi:predicted transcriptional regulator